MRKLLLINLSLLLSLGCATGPVRNETFVNYYAAQSEYSESRSNGDGHSYINFYLTDGIPPEQVNTIALFPAGYDEVYKFDSVNFPDKKWLDFFRESIKAKLIKDYSYKYVDGSAIDTPSNWSEKVDSYSHNIKVDLMWDKIKSITKANKKEPTRELIDSLFKFYDEPDNYIITPMAIDSYIDNDDFYRDNRIKREYALWNGKACYNSICDSITNIVQIELSSKGLFKIIPPSLGICDFVFLDNDWINPWYAWYCQASDSLPEDKDTIKQRSEAIFQSLGADAYIVIDISFNNFCTMRMNSSAPEFLLDRLFNKGNNYEVRRQLFLNVSIIGPEFNVLWSADLPISKQMKWSANLPTNKEMKNIYANEIIDYNMARENIKRALSRITSNKIR